MRSSLRVAPATGDIPFLHDCNACPNELVYRQSGKPNYTHFSSQKFKQQWQCSFLQSCWTESSPSVCLHYLYNEHVVLHTKLFSRANHNYENDADAKLPTNCVKLTLCGYEYPAKSAILARFRPDIPFPKQYHDIMDYEEIWVEELLTPVSFDPFTKEEEAAVNTGQFTNVRRHGPPGTVAGRGGRGGSNRSGRGPSRAFGDLSHSHSFTEQSSIPASVTHQSSSDLEYNAEGGHADVLWNMPAADSILGTFDEKGNFMISSSTYIDTHATTKVSQSSEIPGHDRLPPPGTVVRSEKQQISKEAAPSNKVRWLYRDPAGQVQGPFANEKMLHWYNRGYFPETLPLRREQDILFEPLSAWKLKYGGICPFELEKKETEPSTTTIKPTKAIQPASPSVPLPLSCTTAAAASQVSTSHTADIFAQLGIPWSSAINNSPPMESSVLPTVATGNNPSTGPLSKALAQDELQFLQTFNVNKSPETASLVDPLSKLNVSAHSTATSSKSNITSIYVQPVTKKIIPPKPLISSSEVKPAIPPMVGWAKPISEQVRSLDEIIREQEQAEAARRSSFLANANSPKSFADMLRETDDYQSGSVNANLPMVTPKSPSMISPSNRPSGSSPILSSSTKQQRSEPTLIESPPNSIKSWCLAQLKPLEQIYDIQMCTILLMEFKTPQEITGFIQDNLKSNKINLKDFTQEFIERRFGPRVTIPSLDEERPKPEPEFTTVSRKFRKK